MFPRPNHAFHYSRRHGESIVQTASISTTQSHLKEFESIFFTLSDDFTHGRIPALCKSTNISSSRLYYWHTKFKHERQWRTNLIHSAESQCTFTDPEEYELPREWFALLGPGVSGDAIRFHEEVMERQGSQNRCGDPLALLGVNTNVTDWPLLRRRSNINEQDFQAFIEMVQQLLQMYPPDRIINVDEINWS
jgi:hypothetical protein